jgi:heat shock protein HslJ/uncharacterized lipoprotein NlpE involved in copper resistance
MKKILFLLSLIIIATGCNKTSDKSESSLKISGPFSGVIPCADCEGIYYVLMLNTDSSYSKEMVYLGKDVTPFETKGQWSFADTNKINLKDKDRGTEQFQIVKGNLIMLGGSGKRIEGPLADKFILKPGIMKMPDITSADSSEKTSASNTINGSWTLSEINGHQADKKNYMNGLPNIEIHEADNKFSGSTGCNRINGASTINGNGISFTKFITTRMSCPGTGESEFLTSLSSIDSYKIDKNKLALLSKGNIVMQFSR